MSEKTVRDLSAETQEILRAFNHHKQISVDEIRHRAGDRPEQRDRVLDELEGILIRSGQFYYRAVPVGR